MTTEFSNPAIAPLLPLIETITDPNHKTLAQKIISRQRITNEEALVLFKEFPLSLTGALANFIREQKHGHKTYFNRNFHIEPTNVCIYACKFCSYSRLYKNREEGWELNKEQMMDIVRSYDGKPITEVHIVGGVHPKMDFYFFVDLIKEIKAHRPNLHVKGFTAVELDYMIRKAKLSLEEGMRQLHEAGLDSLPGGGAEIFAPEVRRQICDDKVDGTGWLNIHKQAHLLGMHSNATMLYGHIENYEHRIDHMDRLRQLQDETGGFNTFIPLKFRNHDNEMSDVPESTLIEDMKMYAVARIYLDNFPHLKAYWPMLGRHNAQMTLSFGVNDLDGTIDDTTKIYSMAGSEEQKPAMSTEELVALIQGSGRVAVERDTLYNEINVFDKLAVTEAQKN
jgi:aminodeoxyfutalosine synthase